MTVKQAADNIRAKQGVADSNISIAPSSTTIRNQLVTGPAMLWIIAEP